MTNHKNLDAALKKAVKKINIMILGPGYPSKHLSYRKQIRDALKHDGYNAFVMEDEKDWNRYVTHVDKFADLLKKKENLLCIAIYTKGGSPLGVTFEIGYLCGIFGRPKLRDVLKFLVAEKLPKEEIMTSYIHSGLYKTVPHGDFRNKKDVIEFVEAWTKNRAEELKLLPSL